LIFVRVISKKFLVSSKAARNVSFVAAKEFTTTDAVDLLVNNNFGRYLYNNSGSGCQFRTRSVIKLFEENGFVGVGASATLEGVVQEARQDGSLWVPDDEGEFF